MERITFEELISPDEMTLGFFPVDVQPEQAVERQQDAVGWFELTAAVPEQTRRVFERLTTLHVYGLLCYDFHTVANDMSFLVYEHALGERFVAFYGGVVPVIDKNGVPDLIAASHFAQVRDALRPGGSHAGRRGWQLRLQSGELLRLRPTLEGLLSWARAEGLLPGQRTRHFHKLLARMRHAVAHPVGYHRLMPSQSSRSIADLAEVINQVWGQSTPGGRFYPGPVRRTVQAVAWDDRTNRRFAMRPEAIGRIPEAPNASYVLLMVPDTEIGVNADLLDYDARYESTSLPCDYLWGPGSWEQANAWLEGHRPPDDEVTYLDRPFLMRSRTGNVDPPRRPNVAAAIADDQPGDTWYLVRADYPVDAYVHVRNLVQIPDTECVASGECSACSVTTLVTGTRTEVLADAAQLGFDVNSKVPPDVHVPGAR